uniref:Torsin n=1 Tax=Plectus sambesii TaxID=2011161 RepID=A0A914X0Q7_9BILA
MELFRVVIHLLVLLLLTEVPLARTEPLTIGVLVSTFVTSSAFFNPYHYVKCTWGTECCEKSWGLISDFTGMRMALKQRLYGQHLVLQTVVKVLKAHFDDDSPQKALVLSFHGWTGGGKNYVASIIAQHLYAKGMKSPFVHLFVTSFDFPHSDDVDIYKRQLRSWIVGNVTACERSLFIFDELHLMAIGLMDAIKPFLDHYPQLNGVDFRKSTFIFISNTGGNDITQKTLDYFEAGEYRDKISLREMEEIIKEAAFNEEGGLRFSPLVENNLIDHYIPFLPLERHHVMSCIRDYLKLKLKGRKSTEDRIKSIADLLLYFPKSTQIFSEAGCKSVPRKADLFLPAEKDEKDRFHEEF